MKTNTTIAFAFCVLFSVFGIAQSGPADVENNRIIIKYFPGFQLPNMASDNPDLYDKLNSYFTSSFIVERTDCKGCDVDYDELLNHDLFDVQLFEGFRATSERISINFKSEKYAITLLSEQELSSLLSGDSFDALVKQTFPRWEDTGSIETDYEQYKNNVAYWASLFPEAYRAITSSNTTMKIRFSEFSAMSDQKRSAVLSNPNGYYITD